MKKYILLLLMVCSAWAKLSPFTHIRVGARDASGKPTEEVVDVVVCFERIPDVDSRSKYSRNSYEQMMRYWADYLYEATNGGVFLGKVRMIAGDTTFTGCNVIWKKANVHPNSVSVINNGGTIRMEDDWSKVDDLEMYRVEHAAVVTHESMHSFLGVKDEYGDSEMATSSLVSFKVDVDADAFKVIFTGKKESDWFVFKNHMRIFTPGTPIAFALDDSTAEGSIPKGLKGKPKKNVVTTTGRYIYTMKDRYSVIGQVDEGDLEKNKTFTFTFKETDGSNVDILSAGTGKWHFSLPDEGGASAHTIMDDEHMVRKSMVCDKEHVQWQWMNLSTKYNLNPKSKHAYSCTDAEGNLRSGWEMVLKDPQFDSETCISKKVKPRHWFKSMIGREPTEKDIFHTYTNRVNFDAKTGLWDSTDATWRIRNTCSDYIPVDLPYVKVELNRPEEEYIKETRKYLKLSWINTSKIEVNVVMDWSLSMREREKYQHALLALNYIASGFMDVSKNKTNVKTNNLRLGVFLFNDQVQTLFEPRTGFSLDDVIKATHTAPKPSGQTAMFDAIDKAVNSFSNDSTALKLVYVISDGRDNRSKKTKDDIVKLYESKDIAIHTFAFGEDADLEMLGSMADATGGTYFEQVDSLYIKMYDAVVAALSETNGNGQIAAAAVAPLTRANATYVPKEASRVQIFGSYEGDDESAPLAVMAKNGKPLQFELHKFKRGNSTFFIADVDSSALASLATPYVQVTNKLKNSKLDYRMVASSKRLRHQMEAKVTPTGAYVWPQQGRIEASVRDAAGALAGVDMVGTLVYPDGTERKFNLNDDGDHGDNVAEDGVYSALLPDVNANGLYRWEVRASNRAGKARSPRGDDDVTSAAASSAAVRDKTPFEFIRNGQFVVSGCCTDEPENELLELQPNKRLYAYLQANGDEDRFKIVATEASKSYMLYLKSMDMEAFDKVEVFAPSDLENPVYSVAVKPEAGSPFVTIPLSNELTMPGYVVALRGKTGDVRADAAAAKVASTAPLAGVNYSLALLDVSSSAFSVGRFENAADWHSDSAVATLDSHRKFEGRSSLVSAGGEKLFESRSVSTDDFELVGDRMKLNVFVPSSKINRSELKRNAAERSLGNISLWCVRDGERKQIGEAQQFRHILGSWQPYEFEIPSALVKSLGEPHAEFSFQVAVNSLDSVWVDNLRFIGKLQDNPANKVEIACPGSEGCTESHPITVPENGSVRITANDEAWVGVDALADTNSDIVLDVTPTDGKELSGSVVINGKTHSLSGWIWQKSAISLGKSLRRILFRGLNGRTLRIRTWKKQRGYEFAATSLTEMWPTEISERWNVKF